VLREVAAAARVGQLLAAGRPAAVAVLAKVVNLMVKLVRRLPQQIGALAAVVVLMVTVSAPPEVLAL